ncbi:MAG: deoxyribodipyrimidine photo-lyase [Tenericutes bacterium]|nr:deoxyribodipyrimidine photo-lyase [Mycoplasmatota bacterium]
MNKKRIINVNEKKSNNRKNYVIYWMQQSQRVHYNHALEHAIQLANQFDLPLVVYFGLTSDYPDANMRHYQFMLEGLKEVRDILKKFHISFVLKLKSPDQGILSYLGNAEALVMDQGYLNHQKKWRQNVIDYVEKNGLDIHIDVVDTDLIVPVHIVSNKAEYGAYTLRPKIKKLYLEFRDFTKMSTIKNQTQLELESDDDLSNIDNLIKKLDLDYGVLPSAFYKGGYIEASKMFFNFIQNKVNHYLESNDPSNDYTSKLSMYLHFGQISALEILDRMFLELDRGNVDGQAFDAFIEQLLVRRELAFNYVFYNPGYNQFDQMTEPWAYYTMKEHVNDKREYIYDLKTLESAQTHDAYFNAAMDEMVYTGYMHNYMRMYWAKKIIEWTSDFKSAYDTIIYLNNKYFIDGRDPNSYAGVAWCFGKHDRAWTERHIFGKLRYMNDKGLKRKFNIEKYVEDVNEKKELSGAK